MLAMAPARSIIQTVLWPSRASFAPTQECQRVPNTFFAKLVAAKNANIESYVTEQALNGLFEMIGKQEETIRQNPAAAATSLAKKVFGTL